MDVTEIHAEGFARELKVVVPAADIEEALQKRLHKMAASVKIPGFRPGKVPLPLLKKRYAPSVMGEILENAVNMNSRRALDERALRPVGKPDIEITDYEEGKDLSFTISLELFPEIPEFDLRSLQLTRYIIAVDDDRLDKALADIAERHERFRPLPKPRKARKDDLVIFDFVGSIDGQPFEGGSGQDERVVLGSGRYIKGYEDQMIGCQAGKKARVDVTFPDDYRDSKLAGQQASFALDIKEIQEPEPVCVDERLAKELGHENLESLRVVLRENMAREFDHLSRARLRRDMHDALLVFGEFDLPPRLVETELTRLWDESDSQQHQDSTDTNSPDKGDTQKEADRARARIAVERRIRLSLMLAEIGRKNALSVGQQEIRRAMENQARRYPGQEELFMNHVQNHPQMLEKIREEAYEDKVVDFILEMANISEQEAPLEHLIDAEREEAGPQPASDTATSAKGKKDPPVKGDRRKGSRKEAQKKEATMPRKKENISSFEQESDSQADILSENLSAALTTSQSDNSDLSDGSDQSDNNHKKTARKKDSA